MKILGYFPSALWTASHAGGSLFLASSAWMISGLSASPLVNSLITVMAAIPILIDIEERLGGYWLQVGSVLTLLVSSWFYNDNGISKIVLIIISFLSIFFYYLGMEVSTVPLQKGLLTSSGIRFKTLQICTEIGSLIGAVMTALIFPAISQFIPALFLVLPLASIIYSISKTSALQTSPVSTDDVPTKSGFKINPLCFLQGFVLGGLFAVLALWVRVIDGGKCFDFGVILACYFLGKGLVGFLPKLKLNHMYLIIFILLFLCQVIPLKWISALLFVPIGMLVNSTDLVIALGFSEKDKLLEDWKSFQDQSAIGGIAGGLVLGSICEVVGLDYALPIICFGFIVLSLLSSKRDKFNLANR